MEGEHPSAEKVAAYLDGCLPDDERRAFTDHLARCGQCRREWIAAGDLVMARRRQRRTQWLAKSAAAAAVLAVVVAIPWKMGSAPLGVDALRSDRSAADSAVSIVAISPAQGDTVPARDVVFAWRAHTDDSPYRLSLVDEAGREVWTHDTRDTSVSLPASVSLTPGLLYYWYVDVLDATGRSLSTGLRSFTASP